MVRGKITFKNTEFKSRGYQSRNEFLKSKQRSNRPIFSTIGNYIYYLTDLVTSFGAGADYSGDWRAGRRSNGAVTSPPG